MHMTTTRLYEAAKQLRGITTQSQLARLLDETPQVIKNWESRGMSKQGLLKAEERIGCYAVWLKSGNGPMVAVSAEKDSCKDEINRIIEIAQEEIALSGANLNDAARMQIYRAAIMYRLDLNIPNEEMRKHLSSLIKPA